MSSKKKPAVAVPAVIVPLVEPSDILTLEDVAARLHVSPRWVYEKTRQRCSNPLPTIRIGRYLRFLWTDVSGWLRSNGSAA
jgi:predicted DNA-binding transcriptional regulator AlpA